MKYYLDKALGVNPTYRKIKNIYHFFQAVFANLYFGFPSKNLIVIGITGTDGKTTTTHMIYHILKNAGFGVSMISSVYADIGGKIFETGLHTTTPSSFDIQSFLRRAHESGHTHFVLETTAHGVDQARIWGVNYAVSAVTNITHEHIESEGGYDYFRNFDSYLKTKAQLLLLSKTAIINKDDKSFEKVSHILKNNNHSFQTYGSSRGVNYNFDAISLIPTLGKMNRYNMLAAFSLCRSLGIDKELILKALITFKLPKGRLDLIYSNDFKYIIDFAHTINAIKQALETIRGEFMTKRGGRLIHVFGAAGLRDKTKRALMGEASAEYADSVILTEEDYRTEDPETICDAISEGLIKCGFKKVSQKDFTGKRKEFTVIIDRAAAIKKAVSVARAGDCIVSTGKSHEKSLARGLKEYSWDEYKTAKEAIKLGVKTKT